MNPDQTMPQAIVSPCKKVSGAVSVPGDKSISHRVAMLSALAAGKSFIRGFLRAEDCLNTLKALAALGAEVELAGAEIQIAGGEWHKPDHPLDMGNSGTGMRLMAGLLAGRPWVSELTGDESLRARPMGRIKEPLEKMGARLELTGAKACAPIRITGGNLRGIEYQMPVASAQVKSCVLLAALFAEGETSVIEKEKTRDHTEKAFLQMGIPLKIDGRRIALRGFGAAGPDLRPRRWEVPGDFSSAAFWLAAACARPGSELVVKHVGLNPRRTALLNVLKRMGAEIKIALEEKGERGEPYGAIRVAGAELKAVEVGGAEVPNVIDELPLVAVLGALARGKTIIRGAGELRVKESDRITGLARNLSRLGVNVREQADGLIVQGGGKIRGDVTLESYGDHRLAMAMAILALAAEGEITIRNIDCVATSYPSFWEHLRSIGADVKLGHCD